MLAVPSVLASLVMVGAEVVLGFDRCQKGCDSLELEGSGQVGDAVWGVPVASSGLLFSNSTGRWAVDQQERDAALSCGVLGFDLTAKSKACRQIKPSVPLARTAGAIQRPGEGSRVSRSKQSRNLAAETVDHIQAGPCQHSSMWTGDSVSSVMDWDSAEGRTWWE